MGLIHSFHLVCLFPGRRQDFRTARRVVDRLQVVKMGETHGQPPPGSPKGTKQPPCESNFGCAYVIFKRNVANGGVGGQLVRPSALIRPDGTRRLSRC